MYLLNRQKIDKKNKEKKGREENGCMGHID
jgi:hypothetical protein